MAEAGDPVWSPVGHKLVFSDFGDVYIADLATGETVKVVSRGGYANAVEGYPQRCANFVWHPDGKALIYEYKKDYFKETKGQHYIIEISQ